MDWTIKYLKKDGIVHAKITGVVTWGENKNMSEEIFSFGRKRDTRRYLLEHPRFEHKLSVLQIDDLPKLFKELGFGTEDKLAFLVNQSSKELKFLEDVSRLASLQVKHFTEFEKAQSWLKSEKAEERKTTAEKQTTDAEHPK
jgi:hypothetical protein